MVPVDDEKIEKKEEDESKDANFEFKEALSTAITTEKPNVKWYDIAGLEKAKDILEQAFILPIKLPQLYLGKRNPWGGILLYGPPGTGKSLLAKACAAEARATLFSVNSSELVTKWLGESERFVRSLFEIVRASYPAVIFIDEIDSLCGSHKSGDNYSSRRVLKEFLIQMEGMDKDSTGLLVLGATNTPWKLDIAIRKRFEKNVYIQLPEKTARKTMFKLHLGNTPYSLTEEDLEILAKYTEGYSGYDISLLVKDALMEPIRKCQAATRFVVTKDGYYIPTAPNDPNGEPFTVNTVPDPTKLRTSLISLVKLNTKS